MPKRIFVCSPLRAETSEGYARNIQIARELTRAVLLAGHAPYTPHIWYTSHLDDRDPAQRKLGMEAALAWLRVSDELWAYAVDESECSSGMKSEISLCGKFQIPVKVVWMPECFAEVRARHVVDRALPIGESLTDRLFGKEDKPKWPAPACSKCNTPGTWVRVVPHDPTSPFVCENCGEQLQGT